MARRTGGPRRARVLVYGIGVLVLALVIAALYRVAVPQAAVAQVKIGAPAPDVSFTTLDGTAHHLSEFRGRPVMLWLFATWCDTCQAGTEAVARHRQQLEQTGLQIIQLGLYHNLGYAGPSVGTFAAAFAKIAGTSGFWLWGDAPQQASYTYDPRGYPDIYVLIDKAGIIRTISGAPNVTMDTILSFAKEGRG